MFDDEEIPEDYGLASDSQFKLNLSRTLLACLYVHFSELVLVPGIC